MPAVSEKQRKFMGAELARKRAGKKTETGMSEKQLSEFASKPAGHTEQHHYEGMSMHPITYEGAPPGESHERTMSEVVDELTYCYVRDQDLCPNCGSSSCPGC